MARRLTSEMSIEEAEHVRRLARRARKLQRMGKPQRVLPAEIEAARRKIRKFHAAGMSYDSMAAASGVSQSSINDLARGANKSTAREIYNKVMALEFAAPTARTYGAVSAAVGAYRRLEGLCADGWPGVELAAMLNMEAANLRKLMRDGRPVKSSTRDAIAVLYDKLLHTNPRDYGISARSINYAKTWASKKDYAPTSCWDSDTIDDPDAIPEWTGHCGTTYGHTIHRRDDIPTCEACKAAWNADQQGRRHAHIEVRHAQIRDLAEDGLSHAEIADRVGCGLRTVQRVLNKEGKE